MHGYNIMLHIRLSPNHYLNDRFCLCESRQNIFCNNVGRSRACGKVRLANVSQQSFCFHQHGFENHFTGLDSCNREFDYSQSWNAALCNDRPPTFVEKQQQSSRSEQRKGTPLRKRTNKDHFRCLITILSIGIAKRGLKFDQNWHFSLLLPVAQN